MNIMFLLSPKNETVFESKDTAIHEVLSRMEAHGLTAIPVIDAQGKYFGTVTEGDILRLFSANPDKTFQLIGQEPASNVVRRDRHACVGVNETFDHLVSLALSQNFVPVVDDEGIYSGIIKRAHIIEYLYHFMINKSERTL